MEHRATSLPDSDVMSHGVLMYLHRNVELFEWFTRKQSEIRQVDTGRQ
jgi:hypothetical protein